MKKMNKESSMSMESMDFENMDNTIVLKDQNGKDVKYEFLDLMEYRNREFIIMMPIETDDKTGVEIMEVVEDPDNEGAEAFISVMDAELLEAVFQTFKRNFEAALKELKEDPSFLEELK